MQVNQECGKSTLTNSILKNEIATQGEISKKNKMGKNTTTDVTLYQVDKDTYILDTPGFQTIDIYEIDSKDLEKYFIEFKNHIKNCEFVGCTHIKEENCGIKEALKQGKIQVERYENYVRIYNDLRDKEEHKW